jgi:hypothetical protein
LEKKTNKQTPNVGKYFIPLAAEFVVSSSCGFSCDMSPTTSKSYPSFETDLHIRQEAYVRIIPRFISKLICNEVKAVRLKETMW